MKKKKWAVNPDQHIGMISEFVKKYLKLDTNERLVCFSNKQLTYNEYLIFYRHFLSYLNLFFSFFILIRHLLLLQIKLLEIYMIAMERMEN